jgi:hypothetical protein
MLCKCVFINALHMVIVWRLQEETQTPHERFASPEFLALLSVFLCAAVDRGDRAVGFCIRLVFPDATIPRSARNPDSHIQK